MSIAIDEAEEWAQSLYVGSSHIERHDGRAVSVPDYSQKVSLRAEGYVAGRTAEPTEAEIEAAAKAMCEHNHRISAELGHLHRRSAWDLASESVRAIYRKYALIALSAARKAVTE